MVIFKYSMLTHTAHEKRRSHRSVVLASAERLSVLEIQAATPLAERPTWGKLEAAIATSDSSCFAEAITAFESQLGASTSLDFSSRAEAEAAAALAQMELFQCRIERTEITDVQLKRVANILHDIRGIVQCSPFSEAESYAFELELLQALLENGHVAFLSSPREENSQDPSVNSDLYLFNQSNGQKVPISAKLGAKKSATYTNGVRSVSRKDWQRKGMSLIDYLRHRIPELA